MIFAPGNGVKPTLSRGATDIAKLFSGTFGMNEEQIEFHEKLSGVYKRNKKDVITLSHELHELSKSYEGNDRAIKDYIKNIDVSADGAKDFANSIRASSRAMLGAKVTAMALNAAISFGVSAVVSLAVKAWSEYHKRLERATDATEDFKNKIETLESAFGTYDKLNGILQDETSTTEELNQAKEDLLKLQEGIIDAYGDTAGRIDLVNGKYEDQIKLLEKIRVEEAKAYIRDNKTDLDETTRKMNDDYAFDVTGLTRYNDSTKIGSAIRGIADKYDSLTVTENFFGEAELSFKSKVKDAREQLNLIYSDFEELRKSATSEVEIQFIDNILTGLSAKMNQWDEKFSAARDAYETYTGYAVYAADDITTSNGVASFANLYEEYGKEVNEFNEAVATGNHELIEQARSELDAARNAAESAIDSAREDIHFDNKQVNAIADAFAYLGEKADFATANLKNAEHILRGLTTGEVLTHNLTTEPAEEQVADFVKYYEDEMRKAQELGVDFTKTVYGNIDTNTRQILEWTEENVEGFRDALESWSTATDPINADDYLGSYSTVDTRVEEFDGMNIAFTPILNTPNGAVYLDQDTVYKYINTIFENLGNEWTTEEFLKLDAEGFVVNGRKIQNIIADIGETAIATGEAMHFVGSGGSVATTLDELSGTSVITDAELKNIKEMKFSIVELKSYLNSTEGAPYLSRLQSLADSLEIEFDDLLNILVQLGYLADLQTPIGEEDIELFEEYGDVIEKVINGQSDYASLTDAEKAAVDRFNVSAEKRNILTSDYLTLNKEAQSAAFSAALAASASANDKLSDATEEAVEAMEDMDTIVATVNKKMYLTDEQMSDLVSRHSDLADSLEWTEKGWTLEADAMDLAKSASTSLQSAYIAAHQKMTEMCSTATANRLKMYGIELTSMKSLATAFSKMAGRRMDITLMKTEAGQEYYEYAKSQGYTPFTAGDTTAEEKQMTEFVINQFKTLEFLEDAEEQMKNLTGAIGATSGGSSSSVEKYLADLDPLYKALEKQKRVEEDITDLQREREGLEEDDFDGRIRNIYKEIGALESLNLVLQEQNKIRKGEIEKRIAELRKYGMAVTYNAEANEVLVDNYESVNAVAYAYAKATKLGAEATNNLVQRIETLITETHEYNDANRDTLATLKDNIQAVKDYAEEIKNLKLEMVDDYLSKKENYLSHMQDFELWDESQSAEYLEEMLHDLEDFYNAGLIDYEKFVEEYQAITKRIYDSRKESLETILDMIEDMVRQELEDQVDAYEEQKDALNDIIDAKKRIIELTKTENDYNRSLEDKVKEMARLQERIAQLSLDDSREAAAEKATLIDQLADLQDEVDSMQYDKSIELQEEALDEMQENEEAAIDKQIEKIEEMADNANTIHSLVVDRINNDWDDLYQDLVEEQTTPYVQKCA